MTQGTILAIDQGTTGTLVLVLDHGGTIQGRAYSEFTQYYPKPGWVEHDANEVWQVTHQVIQDALGDAGITANEVCAIGITNQRESIVLWDRKTGAPVGRSIVWQDRRTSALCDELRQEGLEPVWQEKTGLIIDPYFSASKIHWMLENIEGLAARCEDGDIAFGTIDSWLVWELTHGACHITDYTNASRTLLYNIHTLEWDEDILSRLDIPRAMLPEVKPSSCVYGETDPEVFFGHRVPIAGIAGDQQAALFGQACYQQGLGKNTYGTGSFLLMNTGTRPIVSKERLLTTIAWGIDDQPVEYALEGAIFITGAAIQWLRDGLGILTDAAESEQLAASVESNDDVYFVPALVGLGAPHWDPYARGTLIGITRGTSREHIVRAALESIAYQTRDVVEAMRRESGLELGELRADGSAAENGFLMQFQSDILGVPVQIPAITQTTAMGSAYLAGLAVGFWQSREELDAKWQMARRFTPQMNKSERDRLYTRWQQAVQRSLAWTQRES